MEREIMELIDNQLLDSVSAKAAESPRLRMNYNFHTSLDASSQRLLNAIQNIEKKKSLVITKLYAYICNGRAGRG